MKLTKSEKCAIIICILFLALALGFALGRRKQESVFVVTESAFTAEKSSSAGESAPSGTEMININTAPAEELETLEGIGPVLADEIYRYFHEKESSEA